MSGRDYSVLPARRLLLLSIVIVFTTGCGSAIREPSLGSGSTGVCPSPHGEFSNFGTVFDAEAEVTAPALSSLLWEGELLAFDVDRVAFEARQDGSLSITPWAGERAVDEVLVLEAANESCQDGRWRFTSRWDGLLLEGVAAGLLVTGGALLPAARRIEYSLHLTEAGDLALHHFTRVAGSAFFIFPIYSKSDEAWFVYRQLSNQTTSTQQSDNPDQPSQR